MCPLYLRALSPFRALRQRPLCLRGSASREGPTILWLSKLSCPSTGSLQTVKFEVPRLLSHVTPGFVFFRKFGLSLRPSVWTRSVVPLGLRAAVGANASKEGVKIVLLAPAFVVYLCAAHGPLGTLVACQPRTVRISFEAPHCRLKSRRSRCSTSPAEIIGRRV